MGLTIATPVVWEDKGKEFISGETGKPVSGYVDVTFDGGPTAGKWAFVASDILTGLVLLKISTEIEPIGGLINVSHSSGTHLLAITTAAGTAVTDALDAVVIRFKWEGYV